jgi:hypothetical protein
MGRECNMYVTFMEETKDVHRILFGKPEGKIQLGRQSSNWEIMLKWILKGIRRCGLASSGSGYGPEPRSSEHGNEPLNLKKRGIS